MLGYLANAFHLPFLRLFYFSRTLALYVIKSLLIVSAIVLFDVREKSQRWILLFQRS